MNSTNIWVQFRKAIESFSHQYDLNGACQGCESGIATNRHITTKGRHENESHWKRVAANPDRLAGFVACRWQRDYRQKEAMTGKVMCERVREPSVQARRSE